MRGTPLLSTIASRERARMIEKVQITLNINGQDYPVSVEPRRMSDVTDRLLRAVDMERAKRARQRNFAGLHAALAALNTIALPLDGAAVEAPMCYPFLPAADVDREKLVAAGLFVPTLWPEIDSRPHVGFAWERMVARRLLPLPIDHRYGHEDMTRVTDAVLDIAA